MTAVEIIREECRTRAMPLGVLQSRAQNHDVVAARRAIARRLSSERGLSDGQIGLWLRRHHTTVWNLRHGHGPRTTDAGV